VNSHQRLQQETWLKDPNATVPDYCEITVKKMEPAKVKKELENFASLVTVFGHRSSIVKECGPYASWKARLPPTILEELMKFSGWERSCEQCCFLISMPGENDPLEIADDHAVSWFKPIVQHNFIFV